jgi:hypothetical protein
MAGHGDDTGASDLIMKRARKSVATKPTLADTERLLQQIKAHAAACYRAGEADAMDYLVDECRAIVRQYRADRDAADKHLDREAQRLGIAQRQPRRKQARLK